MDDGEETADEEEDELADDCEMLLDEETPVVEEEEEGEEDEEQWGAEPGGDGCPIAAGCSETSSGCPLEPFGSIFRV